LYAAELIYDNFYNLNDDNQTVTYPDDFAGARLDYYGNLRVHLVADKADISKYEELLKDFDCVIYDIYAKYSLNELNQIREIVVEALQKNNYPMLSYGFRVHTNKLSLGFIDIDDEMQKDIESFLADFIMQNEVLTAMNVTTDLFVLEEGKDFLHRPLYEKTYIDDTIIGDRYAYYKAIGKPY